MPQSVRHRILAALTDEAATRAALSGNDSDPVPGTEPFTKTQPSVEPAETTDR